MNGETPETQDHFPPVERRRVAVLGGGIAALTTVAALTEDPGWRTKYDITVYQMGWRVGGKGASGRDPDNADRIEEHGLHIWFGFYENAFRLMRQLYAELGREPSEPMATWQDAFKPHSTVVLQEHVDGLWKQWAMEMPLHDGLPGDGGPESTPSDWVRGLLDASRRMIRMFFAYGIISGYNGTEESLVRNIGRASATSLMMLLNLADKASNGTAEFFGRMLPFGSGETAAAVRRSRQVFSKALQGRFEKNDDMRRLWIILDLTLTVLYGILKDRVLERGFDSIDHVDFIEWLEHHGASQMTTRSAPVRAVYDLAFAYEDGDVHRPNFAAGTTLRGYLRGLFSYKGAFMWKMQAGMGDIVFTPLYEVLRRRGVQFKFFHKVEHLGLCEEKKSVRTIRIARQATVLHGDYQPLVDVKGLPCWPDRPLYDQLAEGAELLERGIDLESSWSPWQPVEVLTLEQGRDFDEIVLGISIAALPAICAEIIASSRAWQRMVENVKTVQTLASQMWFAPGSRQMGYSAPTQRDEDPIQGAYVEPIDTWADLTHLVDAENWPAGQRPGHIGYFCGPLDQPGPLPAPSDHEFPEREKARVKAMFKEFLERDAAHLWPRAVDSETGAWRWDLLIDLQGRSGPARLEAQYFRANVEPTERYVMSVKGSTRYRLKADESGLDNLFLTGDWTDNGFNSGCIEAAVMSGLLCARAVSGEPVFVSGEIRFSESMNSWNEQYTVLRECPNCGIESALIEWVDPTLPPGAAADTTCRFCGRKERGGVLVEPGRKFGDSAEALSVLSAWSKQEGTANTEIFSRSNFRGLSAREVAQRVVLQRPTATSFASLSWLVEEKEGQAVPAAPAAGATCESASSRALVAARALASVALADGIVTCEETTFINRFLDESGFPAMQPEDLRPWLPTDLACPVERDAFIETLLGLAWADRTLSPREWDVIRQFAVAWAFPLDRLEQLNASFELTHAPLVRRLWANLRKLVGAESMDPA